MAWDSSHACTIAPKYHDHEFGGHVSLEDFAANAQMIFIGKVNTIISPGKTKFQILETAKSSQKNSTAVVFFEDVRGSIHLQGHDDQAFSSERELIEYIDFISGLKPEGIPMKGSGGTLAGIIHGSDCERKILTYAQQEYLVFLNDQNFVMAMFPILGSTIPDLSYTIKEISRTIQNPTKMFEPSLQ